ncbi:riboflavin biosynthesis protein [Candidatus Photodesmus blepharus]|uniref:Riboflavin biosynthesis protein RibD n=1 Tax=Candidatus Photodesmus blepharonis TaxID=1179155 RepID=A0A084CPD8_9GAMM|nr:bifunctional diaminohydroxyphosphoribosylaminopyrimidine deaminase/5-amino-6-(5-phosphoribosylamino)uracil reductase RibD [Candidatus Photodesmus blepharus]KEY91667.1 riboflavin biosynthesis protein [Candidatus Photodesmus blepharus]
MEKFSSRDRQMMLRAIELARAGVYTTSPNPNVGCVITNNDRIVGEGFHYRAGQFHAEVNALRMAGACSVGATVYVTLEPCAHYGRMPPCAEGLINARVLKVICAMEDPNPKVSGRGIRMLQDAGIEVEVGLFQSDAEALNPGFIKRMKKGMPFVQLKMAASLDGRTALSNGKSQWITSLQARQDVQVFRAKSDAILSTGKTVVEDNASLSVRWQDFPKSLQIRYPQSQVRQPIRIILDRSGRLHDGLQLFKSLGSLLIVDSKQEKINAPVNFNNQLDLSKVFMSLAEQYHINYLWIEAGETLASSLIKSGLVDELVFYLAPKIIGSDGRGLFGALGLGDMADVLELKIKDVRQIGCDIRIITTVESKGVVKQEES